MNTEFTEQLRKLTIPLLIFIVTIFILYKIISASNDVLDKQYAERQATAEKLRKLCHPYVVVITFKFDNKNYIICTDKNSQFKISEF